MNFVVNGYFENFEPIDIYDLDHKNILNLIVFIQEEEYDDIIKSILKLDIGKLFIIIDMKKEQTTLSLIQNDIILKLAKYHLDLKSIFINDILYENIIKETIAKEKLDGSFLHHISNYKFHILFTILFLILFINFTILFIFYTENQKNINIYQNNILLSQNQYAVLLEQFNNLNITIYQDLYFKQIQIQNLTNTLQEFNESVTIKFALINDEEGGIYSELNYQNKMLNQNEIDINELENTTRNLDENIQEIQLKLLGFEFRINNLNETIQNEIFDTNENFENVQLDIIEISKNLNNTISQLQYLNTTLIEDIQNIDLEISEIATNLNNTISQLQYLNTTLIEDIQNIDLDILDINTNLDNIVEDIIYLNTTLIQDIQNLDLDILDIDTNIDQILNNIGILEEENNFIDVEINTINKKIEIIQQEIYNLNQTANF